MRNCGVTSSGRTQLGIKARQLIWRPGERYVVGTYASSMTQPDVLRQLASLVIQNYPDWCGKKQQNGKPDVGFKSQISNESRRIAGRQQNV